MNILTHKLCSIQGRLFELSAKRGFDSVEFAKTYMNSDTAAKFNSAYDRSQWMGEEYLLEESIRTNIIPKGKVYSADVMFWMGYTYAYWSIVYGDGCKKIVKMANPKVMAENYPGLHTVSIDMAVQDLKGQYWSRGDNGVKLIEEVNKKILKDALNSRNDISDYQRFLNDLGTEILFYLKNKSSIRAYNNQLEQYQRYIGGKMFVTYIDYILGLIDNADISPREKAEYSFVVEDIARKAALNGFSKSQFVFLDKLESKLK